MTNSLALHNCHHLYSCWCWKQTGRLWLPCFQYMLWTWNPKVTLVGHLSKMNSPLSCHYSDCRRKKSSPGGSTRGKPSAELMWSYCQLQRLKIKRNQKMRNGARVCLAGFKGHTAGTQIFRPDRSFHVLNCGLIKCYIALPCLFVPSQPAEVCLHDILGSFSLRRRDRLMDSV